jgi:group I intron endonuclease
MCIDYNSGNKTTMININVDVNSYYKDISLESTLKQIRTKNKNLWGIYGFKNEISLDTNDMYIGSSSNVGKRFEEHLKNINSNIHLQNAMNKYGRENFSFLLFREYHYDHNYSKEDNGDLLVILEQIYLDMVKPNYNINPVAGKSRLGSNHSESSKKLMRMVNLGENNPFYGKTHTQEVKEMLSKRMSGPNNPMAGKPISEFVRVAIQREHNQTVYLYNYETKELIKDFPSQKIFMEEFCVSPKTVIKYIKSGAVWRKKYIISSVPLPEDNPSVPLSER